MHIEMEWDDLFSPKVVAAKTTALEMSFRAGFREPLLASRRHLANAIDENFATAGHGTWAPLSPKTVLKKKKNKNKILIESGRLRRSAAALGRWHVDNNEAVFSNLPGSVEYGYLHITGTNKMPSRNWLDVDGDSLVDEIGIAVFGPWLATKLEKAGF